MGTGTRLRGAWALGAATLMVLAGCSAPVPELAQAPAGSGTSGGDGPDLHVPTGTLELPEGVDAFYDQSLDWTSCGGSDECAQLTVPVNYQDPEGATIEIELLRVPATGNRLGSLVINPGGPGGSGVDYASYAASSFGSAVTGAYDIVGFDPRGVGRSSPVICLGDARMDEYIELSTFRADEERPEGLDAMIEEFIQGCQDNAGVLMPHVSTIEVARDMDILRSALGEQELDYYGASYGTSIGTTYANLYPDRVGRFVLDGAVAPTVTGFERGLAQAEGFERATQAYVEDCVAGGDCPLGDSVDTALAAIPEFLSGLNDNPIPISGDTIPELTEARAFWGVIVAMYDEQFWPFLTMAFDGAINRNDGSTLMLLSNAYFSRTPDGVFENNGSQVILAVNCLDAQSQPGAEDDSISDEEALAAYLDISPTWGAYFPGDGVCSQWPVAPQEALTDFNAAGAPPIVVVGTSRDPATPVEWSQALADLLDEGVLLTYDGDGHTAYGRGSQCIDDAIDEFLVEGVVPEDGMVC